MANNRRSLLTERTTLRTVLVALGVVIVGVALLYLSALKGLWTGRESVQSVVRDIGGLLVATVAVTLLWELYGKRVFLDELLAKARLAEEVRSAGIVGFTGFYSRNLDWESLFRTVKKLDIFFAYGRTWRNLYAEQLAAVAAKKDARIRVVLPDPENEITVAELAWRFNYTSEELIDRIREAEEYFRSLRSENASTGAKIDIWFLPASPLFTSYRFDRTVVLALYTHRRERIWVPTFILESGGTLYDFIRTEFDAIIREDGGLARLVTETEGEQ